MGVVALCFSGLYLAFALIVPLFVARKRTGTSSLRSTPGVAGRIAQLLFLAGNVLIVAGPTLDLSVPTSRARSIDSPTIHACGILLASVALALILASRRAMGASWRVGVDVSEHTPLVTQGPFGKVRHPIYTAMVSLAIAIALMVPNLLTAVALAFWLVAVQVQTRLIEDPYLLRTHPEFNRYAQTTGRFLPLVGRRRPKG